MLNGTTYTPTDTVGGRFNTFNPDTGVPITLAGSPVLRLERLRAGTWSEITGDGITLAVDEDDTGRHEFTIDLDDANITAAAGDLYVVAINVGTVDGNSVVGVAVGHFFVEADGLTAAQATDVETATEAGLTSYGAAVPGDEMALEDDAITAAKYDGATAFPLASADSGATEVARTGADGDTLENLSDEIAGVDTKVDSAQADLDLLAGADGATLATSQPNYEPATAAALQTVDNEIADIDTVVDAIKAKTDGLTFTTEGEVDVNVQSINDAALTGDGTVGTEWGPA
jgi:hypothetical protein